MLSTPNDWLYLAEGGKHVIFRHLDERLAVERNAVTDTSSEYFYGHVLRIQKSDLARAAQAVITNPQQRGDEASSQHTNHRFDLRESNDLMTSSERFRRLIVGPNLGSCYLDSHQTIVLPAPFCLHLYQTAMASGIIPSSRLSSWQAKDQDNVHLANFNQIKAALLPNHTILKLDPLFISPQNANNPTILSVEIKPKAGYLADSPLVLPAHRCKYYHTRYFLQQVLMEKGVVKKGWWRQKEQQASVVDDRNTATQHNFVRSHYSPLDLFSGNFMQVKEALMELSKNMQNNFRVWYEGTMVFGEYENFPSTRYTEILHDFFRTHHCSHNFSGARSILLDVIVHIVAEILHREKILENLLCLQLLDVIDCDGAVLVYNRLVSLCGGSNSEAEMAVEQNFIPPESSLSSYESSESDSLTQDLFACSPYQPPQDSRLRELLNEIQHFRTHLRHQIQSGFAADESIANTFHKSCVYHVKHLSKESCIYLLSNWLLSLTMCDVSLFVTFHFWEFGDSDDLNEEMLIERHQTERNGGLFVCRLDNIWGSPNAMIWYEVKVVDCDPKPSIKLRGREEVEHNFQFVF
ncbi:hypothetical protein ACHAW6_002535 [Cyclotella cf. meneghiniana]